ncbi:cytochrome c oxidase subunit 3 [Sphingomicrobium sediminis]|uniref:Cytochrome c oxidase subunit 3 n=1 Tax=Sphingomicrobium sediminis TaxID=2950949 RepID=A0A9X2J5I6_9SPHN|nr:cytochrome c oxidase subunit 3 [Sphingomicrobium sediminis]MCM8558282.1 cytochrome c oxidase subunit 3 [Sphingomicrobium sediminis]
MAGTVNHDYHILPPSIWPLVGATSAMIMLAGAVFWMSDYAVGPYMFGAGLIGVLFTFWSWWADVVKEANGGDHTPVVQLHHRYGMILFIASEVMFFVAWFWAYFNASLFPPEVIGAEWPPAGKEVLNPFGYPLLNTLILLCSGTTVTWAHHALIHGDRDGLKKGLLATIGLGVVFSAIQAFEYSVAPFAFSVENGGDIYGSTFYMATGFHGFHVLVGTIFLIVCYFRARRGDFTPKQHFGFEAAAWYWHFVDVVWLFLFATIYVWGGWGATYH